MARSEPDRHRGAGEDGERGGLSEGAPDQPTTTSGAGGDGPNQPAGPLAESVPEIVAYLRDYADRQEQGYRRDLAADRIEAAYAQSGAATAARIAADKLDAALAESAPTPPREPEGLREAAREFIALVDGSVARGSWTPPMRRALDRLRALSTPSPEPGRGCICDDLPTFNELAAGKVWRADESCPVHGTTPGGEDR